MRGRLHESLRRHRKLILAPPFHRRGRSAREDGGKSDGRVSAARLEDRLQRRGNNFDVLRLVAASLVLFSHSYALTGNAEPFAEVSGWTFGEVGVVMFFAMSGFLIAKSWGDLPQLVPFTVKRALRILPALVVAVSVTVFVIGPLFTTLPLGSYFSDPVTWLYLVRASLLITFFGTLPGVFEDNPYPDAVNGSLWTLPVEACCYALAAALGTLGLLRRSVLLAGFSCLLVLYVTPLSPFSNAPAGGTTGGEPHARDHAGRHLHARDPGLLAARAAAPELGDRRRAHGALDRDVGRRLGEGDRRPGDLVLCPRVRVPHSGLAAAPDGSRRRLLRHLCLRFSGAAIGGGTRGGVDPLVMFAIVFPVTYGLAFISWRLVERPALALKRVVAPRPQAPAAVGRARPA